MAPTRHSFLFVTWNGGGNVAPTLTIAGKLAARGHRVRVVAPRTLAGAVRDAGCDVVPFARAPERTQSSPSILGRVGRLCR
jgi:UDP:flavonoid glycosyltransferase YjiC (YdhE family)